jgi:hypothetical protein
MGEYRNRTTGELKSQGELRRDNPNISLPRVWNENVYELLNIDPVLAAPKPTEVGVYQTVVRDGVVQDANDNWVENWVVRDMFEDTTEDGVTTTKAQHEAAHQASLDEAAAEVNRSLRNDLLSKSDWTQINDSPLTTELKASWATYRQALRDISNLASWPNIEPDDWPVAP